MLTHYKCKKNKNILEPNIYRGWTVLGRNGRESMNDSLQTLKTLFNLIPKLTN